MEEMQLTGINTDASHHHNPAVLNHLCDVLNLAFIQVGNGGEASEQCRQRGVDLVCVDVQMPCPDGIETNRSIRKFSDDPL